jgi:hypothetical protein
MSSLLLDKNIIHARCQWLTPVIIATQEAWDQEDHGSKPAQANSSQDPISKIPNIKKINK